MLLPQTPNLLDQSKRRTTYLTFVSDLIGIGSTCGYCRRVRTENEDRRRQSSEKRILKFMRVMMMILSAFLHDCISSLDYMMKEESSGSEHCLCVRCEGVRCEIGR